MIGLILMAASAAYSAYSSNKAGKSAGAIGDYNAAVTLGAANANADSILQTSELNAGVLEQTAAYNAGLTKMEGRATVTESLAQALGLREQGRQLQGTQRARRAASGVVVGTGSSLVVDVAQAGILEKRALDAERLGMNRGNLLEHQALVEMLRGKDAAAIERWKGKSESDLTRWEGQQQAALDRMGASAARSAGKRQAVGTILSTAGSVYAGYSALGGGAKAATAKVPSSTALGSYVNRYAGYT